MNYDKHAMMQGVLIRRPDLDGKADVGLHGFSEQDQADLSAALTVPIPGGVTLTSEEQGFRDHHTMNLSRSVIVARSILTKVRNACAGESTPE